MIALVRGVAVYTEGTINQTNLKYFQPQILSTLNAWFINNNMSMFEGVAIFTHTQVRIGVDIKDFGFQSIEQRLIYKKILT